MRDDGVQGRSQWAVFDEDDGLSWSCLSPKAVESVGKTISIGTCIDGNENGECVGWKLIGDRHIQHLTGGYLPITDDIAEILPVAGFHERFRQ